MMQISVPEAKVTRPIGRRSRRCWRRAIQTAAGWVQGLEQACSTRRSGFATRRSRRRRWTSRACTAAAQYLAFLDTYQQPTAVHQPDRTNDGLRRGAVGADQHAQLTPEPGVRGGAARAHRRGDRMARDDERPPTRSACCRAGNRATTSWPMAISPAMTCGRRRACARRSPMRRLAGPRGPARRRGRRWTRASRQRWTVRSRRRRRAGHIPPVLDRAAARTGQLLRGLSGPGAAAQIAGGQRDDGRGRARTWRRAYRPTSDGASLHDYLGFTVFQTELAAGETGRGRGPVRGARPHDLDGQGWEWDVAPFGDRASPSTWRRTARSRPTTWRSCATCSSRTTSNGGVEPARRRESGVAGAGAAHHRDRAPTDTA